MELAAGDIVSGHYRIVETIGRGGMGQVYSADNLRTGRRVALKLLRADVREKRGVVERFRREAKATGRIQSDYVTQVLDVEEDAEHGLVIVFEMLEGESLIDRLRRVGPMALEDLWPLFDQAWRGLIDAHAARIVHRDLKPSNVFLEKRPGGEVRVKLLDFGIAKLPAELVADEATLTTEGQNLGTYSYMAPEQIGHAKEVDHRADIYAMGTMIFEALAAERPFDARNFPALLEMKLRGEARRLSQVMPRAGAALDTFVARCLAREPEARFTTAVEAHAAWVALRFSPARESVDPERAASTKRDEDRAPASDDATRRRHPASPADAQVGLGGTVKMNRLRTPAHLRAPDASPLSLEPTKIQRRAGAKPGSSTIPMVSADMARGASWPAGQTPASFDRESLNLDDTVDAHEARRNAHLAATVGVSPAQPKRSSRAGFFVACAIGFAVLAAVAFQLARTLMVGSGP